MEENSNIVALRQPDEIDDPTDEYFAIWGPQLLAQAVEMEAAASCLPR